MSEANEQSFFSVLLEDAAAAIERNKDAPTQSQRRDLIRSLFASSEGMIWIFREHIRDAADTADVLRPQESSVLSEQVYSVSVQGEIITQQKFIPLTSAIRLCVNLASRLDPQLEIRFDDTAWQRFRAFAAVRHRLAHPKSVSDLHISDAEVSDCIASFFWLLELVVSTMESANRALAAHNAEFRKIIGELQAGDPVTWAIYRHLLTTDQAN